MTDEPHSLDWTDADSRWVEEETDPVDLSTAIYDGFECPDCDELVTLDEFDGDPDAPSWHGECHGCRKYYTATVQKVTISKTDPDL